MAEFRANTNHGNFVEMVSGIPTEFSIYENEEFFFLYINQNPQNLNIYDDYVLRVLKNNKIREGKKHVVNCSLDSEDSVNDLEKMIIKLFKQ